MAITRGNVSAFLAPNLRRVYVQVYEERPVEYTQVFNVEEMEWNPLSDQNASGLGALPQKGEMSQFTLDDMFLGTAKTYTATPYGLAFEVSKEAIRDELYGYINQMPKELARSARYREEVNAWSMLNNAFSTSYPGFTASESLCSTAHTGLDGTSRANRPSTDVAFSQTAIQNALLNFEAMTNERNLPALIAPSLIIIDPVNKFKAREILGSGGKAYSADNEINALAEEDLNVFISHYLTTNTYWFMLSKKAHDLNFLWRDKTEFDSFDDPRVRSAVFTVYQRHANGYGDWRGVYGSTG